MFLLQLILVVIACVWYTTSLFRVLCICIVPGCCNGGVWLAVKPCSPVVLCGLPSVKVQALRAYSLVDSSQVSTFLISILLIVYGSFRSLNMDLENQDKDKDGNVMAQGTFNANASNNSIQTIDSTQALFLPIGASVSLLVMFFFFDSVQVVFTICTAVLATIAFAFLLLPMCQYLTRPCSPQNKISFGCCGRFTAAELLSFSLSVMLVLIWVLTGHWLLMDALAMGLCVAMIAFVRLPSLKVSCLLLSGLLIYDVFWVFFSAYIFSSNVMVKVATQPADNPLDVLSRKLHLGPNVGRDVPRLSLPGKLVFPSIAAVVCALMCQGGKNKLIPGANITLQPSTPDRRIPTSSDGKKCKWMEMQMDHISLL
ncbi:UNVERIFIED_CONTAM: hypothetical protein FKN15_054601 [Acipenser sinensis]